MIREWEMMNGYELWEGPTVRTVCIWLIPEGLHAADLAPAATEDAARSGARTAKTALQTELEHRAAAIRHQRRVGPVRVADLQFKEFCSILSENKGTSAS